MVLSEDKYHRARIVASRDVSADLRILRIDPGGPFEYRAGQYATLGLELDGVRIERAYSLVSSPYEHELEAFVELVPHGGLTPKLFELQPGDTLLCRRIAKGRFLLDLRSGRANHLFVSTVTGIAPFVSYVRTLYRDWKSGDGPLPGEHKFFCLQGASHSFEFGYREELERSASDAPWFEYLPTVSRPWDEAQWTGETGRVDDLLRKYIGQWGLLPDKTTAYLCGHPRMIENSRGILGRAGWKKDAILEEAFFHPGIKEAGGSP